MPGTAANEVRRRAKDFDGDKEVTPCKPWNLKIVGGMSRAHTNQPPQASSTKLTTPHFVRDLRYMDCILLVWSMV